MERNCPSPPSEVPDHPCRAENGIKNHFYATLRKGLRRLNNIIGYKLDSSKIRKIKPAILSKLSEGVSRLEGSF
jgi:hypothetical protein